MYGIGRRGLMAIAVLSVFIELLVVERCAGGRPDTIEVIVLLAIAAIGSLVIALPFAFVRFCGATRTNTIISAVIVASVLVLLGIVRGDVDMGHSATIPGWIIGAVFGVWILIVGPVAALTTKE